MVRLDQIRALEEKVTKAIDYIARLREENRTLKAGLDSAQKRIDELESLVETFKREQKEIEEGIIRALNNLDRIEDEIHGSTNVREDAPETVEEQPQKVAKEDETPSEETNETQLDIF